ncbi:MAG TPA: hypothetical protein VLK58_04400, partial [Conexibacter sp.]|nr:hypothetical protein [Conexibacter sp.]
MTLLAADPARTTDARVRINAVVAQRVRAISERLVAHPWLLGDPDLPGATIGRRARWLTTG